MLDETALHAMEKRIQKFHDKKDRHHEALNRMLDDYDTLLIDYRSLLATTEEPQKLDDAATDARAPQQTTDNLYVLVLIDGDDHVFDREMIRAKEEGGRQTAQTLKATIEEQVHALGLSECTLIAHVYADVSGLSKNLSRSGLLGNESRALAPFVAGFNSFDPFFDFTDVGKHPESTDTKRAKMAGQLKFGIDDNKCAHVFFGGCHEESYSETLQSRTIRKERKRITLIKTPSFKQVFEKCRMRSIDLSKSSSIAISWHADTVGPSSLESHSPSSWRLSKAPSSTVTSTKAPRNRSPQPSDNEQIIQRQISELDSTGLPAAPTTTANHIVFPLNAHGHRLDTRLQRPTAAAIHAFAQLPRPCNDAVLVGFCKYKDACYYDHRSLDPELLDVLRARLRMTPCRWGHGCRKATCYYGHVCVRAACAASKDERCRFEANAHAVDMDVVEWRRGTTEGSASGSAIVGEPANAGAGVESSGSETDGEAGGGIGNAQAVVGVVEDASDDLISLWSESASSMSP